jgi:hypothetical protein
VADDAVPGEPVCGGKFPVIREKTGNFAQFFLQFGKSALNSIANSGHYFEIPCETEQGIAFA